jgi:hypothetical protein
MIVTFMQGSGTVGAIGMAVDSIDRAVLWWHKFQFALFHFHSLV